MTLREAKLILHSYRPGGEDEADPFFAEALELVHKEDELASWFTAQRAFDSGMTAALQSEVPPADLRAAILEKKTAPHAINLKRPKKPINNLVLWVSMTAAIMILGAVGMFLTTPNQPYDGSSTMTLASFTQQVLDIKEQGKISLGKSGQDTEQLRPWLAQQGAPAKFALPPGLNGMPTHGCQTYMVDGTKVTMVCFAVENGQVAYLFVVDKSALQDAAGKSQADFHEENGIAFATWSSGDKSYVLTGDHLSMETLKKLV